MLGVNSEYQEYGLELLSAIQESGATAAVFDHCVAEAEDAVTARLHSSRSGINRAGSSWGTTAAPTLLAALSGSVGERAESRLIISIQRDPEINLHRRAPTTVGDIESEINRRMFAWRNEEAKAHDRKSVWSMLALRDINKPYARICESGYVLLTRNTPLISISNKAWTTWLQGATQFSSNTIERSTPIAMSDKQFAGYLWARRGGGDGAMSRARLLAHCSAAVRPRADIKAKAYNLVLELHGKDAAEDVAALLEDREGARALMQATRGDPEDVTKDRLPYILDRVKTAAGDYAAAKVREENAALLAKIGTEHSLALEKLQRESEEVATSATQRAKNAEIQLAQEKLEKEQAISRSNALLQSAEESKRQEQQRTASIIANGINVGLSFYRRCRILLAILFGVISGAIAWLSSSDPFLGSIAAAVIATLGFWFVPNILNTPLHKLALRETCRAIREKDTSIVPPAQLKLPE